MAVPLLSKEEVDKELWRRRCKFVKDYGTHELWKTTKIIHFFTVPREGPDKQTGAYEFSRILAEIDHLQDPPP
jgi:hypothetical protein